MILGVKGLKNLWGQKTWAPFLYHLSKVTLILLRTVKFLFLGALGQRETWCWSLCKGLIFICHEQCGWFRQDNDNREQKSWVCYLTLPNINIQILNILLFLFPLVQTMRICWTMVLAIWTWRALMWLQKLQDQFSECIIKWDNIVYFSEVPVLALNEI